jgi:hypothetical protein
LKESCSNPCRNPEFCRKKDEGQRKKAGGQKNNNKRKLREGQEDRGRRTIGQRK